MIHLPLRLVIDKEDFLPFILQHHNILFVFQQIQPLVSPRQTLWWAFSPAATITQTLPFAKPAISSWKVSCWQPFSQVSILFAVAWVNWSSVGILAHGNANLQFTHFLQPSVTSGYPSHCIILGRLPGKILMINSLTGKEIRRVGDGWQHGPFSKAWYIHHISCCVHLCQKVSSESRTFLARAQPFLIMERVNWL